MSASHHYLAAPFQYLQPLPVLARVVAEAGEMTLGTGIMLLALQQPVDVAESFATLDVICGGRFVFGVGLGYRDGCNFYRDERNELACAPFKCTGSGP